jgi:DNA polymerase-3 subunit gamma/tau
MAPDYDAVLADLITMLHDLALAQHMPGGLAIRGLDVHELSSIAAHMSAEEIQLDYEIAVRGRRDLALIPDARNGLEMTLLRMLAFRPARREQTDQDKPLAAKEPPTQQQVSEPVAEPPIAAAVKQPPPSSEKSNKPEPETWGQALQQAKLGGMVKALANHCMMHSYEHGEMRLTLARQHDSLLSDALVGKLTKALNEYYGEAFKLKIDLSEDKPDSPAEQQRRNTEQRQLEAEAAIAADPLVNDFKQHFDAEVVPGSIKPSTKL